MNLLLMAAVPTPAISMQERLPASPICADFLAAFHRKPPALRYIGCRMMTDRQGRPLQATYVVRGRDAARVETTLARTLGLKRLRRSCCQWDAPAHQFSIAGRSYSINMVSAETSIVRRDRWRDIPRFDVVVETLTDDV